MENVAQGAPTEPRRTKHRMHIVVLDALAHLAYADEILFDEERQFLVRLLDQAGIPASQRGRWLEKVPPLPTANQLREALPQPEQRRDFLDNVLRLAKVDDDFDDSEWKVLQTLCRALDAPADTPEELRSWLAQAD